MGIGMHYYLNVERIFNRQYKRGLEDRVLSEIRVQEFLSQLTPEEFEVLWGITGNKTSSEISNLNELTLSQINTIRQSLARKSAILKQR